MNNPKLAKVSIVKFEEKLSKYECETIHRELNYKINWQILA